METNQLRSHVGPCLSSNGSTWLVSTLRGLHHEDPPQRIQVSLSGIDPCLPFAVPVWGCRGSIGYHRLPPATASWGSQLDLALDPSIEEDFLDLDYGEDDDVASNLLISEEEIEDTSRLPLQLGHA